MSEPTYRVELTHKPENGIDTCWHAAVHAVAEDGDFPYLTLHDSFRSTREDAFDAAQAWCKARAQEPLSPSTVLLTEDGDILDPHEVTR